MEWILCVKRRALLSTALGVVSSCLAVSAWAKKGGEGTTIELIPSHNTDQQVCLNVAVHTMDDSLLLDHSYLLPAEHANKHKTSKIALTTVKSD